MSRPALRSLLEQPRMILAPGAWDAVSAQLVEQAGFETVYMSGGITSMSHGYPDYGLLDMGEMIGNAGRMARSIQVPLIADADTGYGNELNVTRCVREYEMRGVAAIHIEDQVQPKRCGHLQGKEVIGRREFVSKIRAAVAARSSADFLIIARSDARAVHGFDEAIVRVNEALLAGADVAFVEAMETFDEVRAVPREVRGPCLLNVVQGGRTPIPDLGEAEAMGYKMAILPTLLFLPMLEAADATLRLVRSGGRLAASSVSVDHLFKRFGAAAWDDVRARAAATEPRS